MQVLRSFTGADYAGFNATVPPGASLVEPGATPSVPVTLAWSTFREMAIQAGARPQGAATHRAGRAGAARGARLRLRVRATPAAARAPGQPAAFTGCQPVTRRRGRAGYSRLLGGIHFHNDNIRGRQMGTAVGWQVRPPLVACALLP